jgi:AhpD family alkylhydroperoxidase
MSEPRLKYGQLAPEGFAKMKELEHYLNTASGLEHTLLELVRLRSSLMNDCEFCIALHTSELRNAGVPEEKISGVAGWRSSQTYTKRERAALEWAEAITNIQDGHAPDAVYEPLRADFSDAEIANLTLALAIINAWNRISISLGRHSHRGAEMKGVEVKA